jgi:uncharacterized membrane protein YkoI
MTRTRVLAALLAGLTLAGIGTAATALGSDDSTAPTPVTVVAQTRTTTPTSTSTSTSTATPTPAPGAATAVTADEANSRAVAYLGGGTATKVEQETEHGRTVWEVEVQGDARVTEVHVDATTGDITRVKDDGRGRDDRGRHGGDDRSGRHSSDDGPDHDRFDDKGGDR